MNTFYGLLGLGLQHSISPLVHKYIFEILGIPAQYHLFEVEDTKLREAVEGLKALNAAGVNVTIPYKTEVIQHLDTISSEAAAIGAVNTIIFRNCNAIGYNTDYFGFGILLEKYDVRLDDMEALVLGYGGGAKAIVRFLLDHGIKNVTVAIRNAHSRQLKKSPDIPDNLIFKDFDKLKLQKGGNLIINCTPCGMYPSIYDTPVPVDVLKRYQTAIDLIYNPPATKFLCDAEEAGLKAINGLYMLVGQAVAAQEIWNNVRLSRTDIDRIYNKVAEYMQKSL